MKLEIDHIDKCYKGKVWALKDLSLDIETGVMGLLGPNGAGKSTLMRILATVSKPDKGLVKWNGVDIVAAPDKLRQILGYLPQDFGVYPHLNTFEFLTYLAAARGLSGPAAGKRIRQLLDLVNLAAVGNRPLGSFSGGMKQRVGIAQALLNDPKLLIVDEPTAGLDPEERIRFRNLLAELSGERIVILSSHIVSDIEAAATAIAIIHRGTLLFHAGPEQLLRQVAGKAWEMVIPSAALQQAKEKFIISNTTRTAEGVRLKIIAAESPGERAAVAAPTLEDAYLYLLSTAGKTIPAG